VSKPCLVTLNNTATDVLLFKRWREFAAKKRRETYKQILVTDFLKNKFFPLQINTAINAILGDFLFDLMLYFLRNLIS
jgi:hypothetical protein